jgi:hypothetical protein
MAEIKWVKGYSPLLIVAAGDGLDNPELIPLREWHLRTEHGGAGAISPELGWAALRWAKLGGDLSYGGDTQWGAHLGFVGHREVAACSCDAESLFFKLGAAGYRRGVGEHQGTSMVLLDPKVDFGRPCSALETAAAAKVSGDAFLKVRGGSSGGAFIGHSSGVERKDSTTKSISNSSLEAMIPLGFVKGENSQFGFDSSVYSGAVTYRARPMVPFALAARCGPEGRVAGSRWRLAGLRRGGDARV